MVFMVRQEQLRSSIVLVLIGFLFLSCGSDKTWKAVDINHEDLEKKQGVYYFSGAPFYGKIIEYFDNGEHGCNSRVRSG